MTHIETAREPNRKRRNESLSARALLGKIIADNPKATKEEITYLFNDATEDDEYLFFFRQFWLNLHLGPMMKPVESVEDRQRRLEERREQNRTAAEENKERLTTRFEHEAKKRLLDIVMPNGKPLAECTFAECGHWGGWLSGIAKQGKATPQKMVGSILSERAVARIRRESKNG